MAERPKAKFVTSGAGKVHVITTRANDLKTSKCATVKSNWTQGKYKGVRGISAEAALDLDHCKKCDVTGWANLIIEDAKTPAQRRAERADVRDDTMARAKGKKPAKGKSMYGRQLDSKTTSKKKPQDRKPKAPGKTKSGLRSVGNMDSKVKALAVFAEENGWSADIGADDATGHTVVTAKSGNMVIDVFFIDGKYDVGRHATITVDGWSGTLRGAHAARRQMDKTLDARDRPHPEPGRGRKARTKSEDPPEDESPEDAAKRVPWSSDDTDDEIIEAIRGHVIRWRNSVSNKVCEAEVPGKSKNLRITVHPKDERRIVHFHEVVYDEKKIAGLGGERSVYLDKIIAVK